MSEWRKPEIETAIRVLNVSTITTHTRTSEVQRAIKRTSKSRSPHKTSVALQQTPRIRQTVE